MQHKRKSLLIWQALVSEGLALKQRMQLRYKLPDGTEDSVSEGLALKQRMQPVSEAYIIWLIGSLRGTCAETEDATFYHRSYPSRNYGLRGTCAETEDATQMRYGC